MTTDNKTLADVQPGGRVRLGDQRSDLVPGIVRCAKCTFQLHRTNLYVQSGTVGAGDSKTEPCPNGCGPLWPVTWETWAREGWAEAERLHLENAALAARQPVGEPVAWMIERLRGKGYGRDKYVVMKGQASSDPDSHLFWTDQQARDNHRVTPLYAAPAQAVDLRQFRPAVCAMGLYAEEPEEVDEAKRLLALIDSQAAGN